MLTNTHSFKQENNLTYCNEIQILPPPCTVIFECQHSLDCATHVPKQIRNCFKNVFCENPSRTLRVQGETVPLEDLKRE